MTARALHLLATAAVGVALLLSAFRFWVLESTLFRGEDFRQYYAIARIGLEHGWSRIYDQQLQCQQFGPIPEATVHCPVLGLPPDAWLVVPFTFVPYPTGYVAWLIFLGTILGVIIYLVWPRLPQPRFLYAAGALSIFPLTYGLFLGQVTIPVVLGLVLAWRFLQAGRQNWAGVALVLICLKPQVALLVPVALLFAGHVRPVVVAVIGATVVAMVSVLSLGWTGLVGYITLAYSSGLGADTNIAYTLSGPFGRGAIVLVLQVGAGVLAIYTAWRLRPDTDSAMVAGILGSALFSPYWHLQDFVIVMAAALIQLNRGSRLPAAAVFVCGFPLLCAVTFVPSWLQVGSWLVLELIWLGWLAIRPSSLGAPSSTMQ